MRENLIRLMKVCVGIANLAVVEISIEEQNKENKTAKEQKRDPHYFAFRTELRDQYAVALFKECIKSIGGVNNFDIESTNERLLENLEK